MADTTSRALQLLSLLQGRRNWSGEELRARLEVSERTLRRDIDRLRELGYPVAATTGPAGGYQLEAGAEIPPLLLDDDEAVAIAMGLLTAAGGTITGIEETSLRALAKLEKILPPRIRKQIQLLQAAVVPLVQAWVTIDAEVLTTVALACRDQERLRFDYVTREGERSERHVEPHQVVALSQRWYLLAYDRDREDWRTFRLDRVENPRATRITFRARPLPGGDALAFVQQSLRSRPTRYQVRAVLQAPADQVAANLHPGQGEVEAFDGHRCRLRTQGDSLEWLAFMLIWHGVDFIVEEPPELIAYLEQLAARLTTAAASSGGAAGLSR